MQQSSMHLAVFSIPEKNAGVDPVSCLIAVISWLPYSGDHDQGGDSSRG